MQKALQHKERVTNRLKRYVPKGKTWGHWVGVIKQQVSLLNCELNLWNLTNPLELTSLRWQKYNSVWTDICHSSLCWHRELPRNQWHSSLCVSIIQLLTVYIYSSICYICRFCREIFWFIFFKVKPNASNIKCISIERNLISWPQEKRLVCQFSGWVKNYCVLFYSKKKSL